MAPSPSTGSAPKAIPNSLRASGSNRRKTIGGTLGTPASDGNISVVCGRRAEIPSFPQTSSSSTTFPTFSLPPSPGHSTGIAASHPPALRKVRSIPSSPASVRTIRVSETLTENLSVPSSGSKSTSSSSSPSPSLTTTSSIPLPRTRRGSSVSANSTPNNNTPKSQTTKPSRSTKNLLPPSSPSPSPSPSTPRTLPVASTSTSPTTSRIARVRAVSTISTPTKIPSQTSASSAKGFSRPKVISTTGTSSAPSNSSASPRGGKVNPNSSTAAISSPSYPFPVPASTDAPSSSLRSPKPVSSSPSSSPSTPSSSVRLRATTLATNPTSDRKNTLRAHAQEGVDTRRLSAMSQSTNLTSDRKRTLHAQESVDTRRLSAISQTSPVSSVGSVYSQSSASWGGNGKGKALEDPSSGTGGESEVEHLGKDKKTVVGKSSRPAELDVLKDVWEDPNTFDPGGTAPTDRSAVKSGYGSVFGFGLASSNSSRKGSVSGNEGSFVRSSITSSISNSSATSDSTTAPALQISATTSTPAIPVPFSQTNTDFRAPSATHPGESNQTQAHSPSVVVSPTASTSTSTSTSTATRTLRLSPTRANSSSSTKRHLSPASPTGPRSPRLSHSGSSKVDGINPANIASGTRFSSASESKIIASSASSPSSARTADTLSISPSLKPRTSTTSLRTTTVPSGPRPTTATTVKSNMVRGTSFEAGMGSSTSGTKSTSSSKAASTATSHMRSPAISRTSASSTPLVTPENPPVTRTNSKCVNSIASSSSPTTKVSDTSKEKTPAMASRLSPVPATASSGERPSVVTNTSSIQPTSSHLSSSSAVNSFLRDTNVNHRSASAPASAANSYHPLQNPSPSQPSPSHSPLSATHHIPHAVNLKQLLSKPAPPGYTSGGGSASESEGGYASMGSRKSRTIDEAEIALRRQRENEAEAAAYLSDTRGKLDRGRERDQIQELESQRKTSRGRSMSRSRSAAVTDTESSKDHGMLKGLKRSASWSRLRGDQESVGKGEKHQRNVLRKRPSTGFDRHSSGGKQVPRSSLMLPVSSLKPPRARSNDGSLSTPSASRSPSKARASPIPPSAQMNGSSRPRSGSEDSTQPSRALTPSGMTPAEEIMLAYKQQQERGRARVREREERAKEREREREIWMKEDERRGREASKVGGSENGQVAQEQAVGSSMEPYVVVSRSSVSNVAPREKPIGPMFATKDFQSPSQIPRSPRLIPENDESKTTSHNSHQLSPARPSPPEFSSKAKLSPGLILNPKGSATLEDSQSGPYYTVFGDTSGRVVAANGIEDSFSDIPSFSWSTSLAEGFSSNLGAGLGLTSEGDAGKSPSEIGAEVWERSSSVTVGYIKPKGFGIGLGKTLSRKMSGRLRGGMTSRSDTFEIVSTSSVQPATVIEQGRPSLQERRGVLRKSSALAERVGQDRGRSLRLSIDKYADKPANASPLPPFTPRTGKVDGSFDLTPLQESFPVLEDSLDSPVNPNVPVESQASAGKKKLWNIVKRISAAGLREKYHSQYADCPGSGSGSGSPASPPPPVPMLPPDLSVFAKGPRANERSKSDPQPKLSQSRPVVATVTSNSGSGSPGRPSVSSSATNRPLFNIPRVPPPSDLNLSTSTRPSTTTRSSSPVSSSEVGSSKFFHRSHSQRSSSSSLEIPPLPNANASSSSQSLNASARAQKLQRYIVPPSELYKLELNPEKEHVNTRPRRLSLTTMTSNSISSSSLTSSHRSMPHSHSQSNLKAHTKRSASSPNDDWVVVPTPKEEKPSFSLPVPQRRRKDADGKVQEADDESMLRRLPPLSDDGRPPSPIMPTFSTAAAINAWGNRPTTSEGRKSKPSPNSSSDDVAHSKGISQASSSSTPPPPLPARSPRRVSSGHVSASTSSRVIAPSRKSESSFSPSSVTNGNLGTTTDDRSFKSRPARKSVFGYSVPSAIPVSPQMRNRSDSAVSPKGTPRTPHDPPQQSANTFGIRSASLSSPPVSSPTPTSAHDSRDRSRTPGQRTPRTPLSEKEKADKWDDLLERSARAGGTLHLTVGTSEELASDRLRFSISAESELDLYE